MSLAATLCQCIRSVSNFAAVNCQRQLCRRTEYVVFLVVFERNRFEPKIQSCIGSGLTNARLVYRTYSSIFSEFVCDRRELVSFWWEQANRRVWSFWPFSNDFLFRELIYGEFWFEFVSDFVPATYIALSLSYTHTVAVQRMNDCSLYSSTKWFWYKLGTTKPETRNKQQK